MPAPNPAPLGGRGAAHSTRVRGPSSWPLWIPVGEGAPQVCHLVFNEGSQLVPGRGLLPVPRCFRDEEEPGEEMVEEEVWGGDG